MRSNINVHSQEDFPNNMTSILHTGVVKQGKVVKFSLVL